MDYPNVPALPGVPALLRVPPSAYSLVSRGLSDASGVMSTVSRIAQADPLSAISTIGAEIADATSLMGSVTDTVTRYVSSDMGRFLPAIQNINTDLASLTSSVVNNPTGPLSSISDTIVSTDLSLDTTSAAFDASLDTEPTLDGVETVTVTAYRNGPQWGIFKDGQTVIKADNVAEFGVKKEWTISDYPVEEGAFQSYNKVYVPFDARVKFTSGGNLDNRQALIDSIDAIAGDLELYDVVMPEKTYQSVNIVHYDVRRKADNGVGLLIVDVYLEEVRATAMAEFSTAASDTGALSPAPAPKSPTAAPKRNNGTVQPKTPGAAIDEINQAGAGIL